MTTKTIGLTGCHQAAPASSNSRYKSSHCVNRIDTVVVFEADMEAHFGGSRRLDNPARRVTR